jgi:hypothetical protein
VPDGSQRLMSGDYYYVSCSPLEEDVIGWIHKNNVIPWNHRECLRFTPLDGRPPVKVYDSNEPVRRILSGLPPGSSPISQEPPGHKPDARYEMLLPVLAKKSFDLQGRKKDVYEIAYIHTPALASSTYSVAFPSQEPHPEDIKLDIVFLFDATQDMQPYIRIVRNVVTRLAFDTSHNYKENIRFGLLVYRDRLMLRETQKIMGNPWEWYLKLGNDNFVYFISKLNEIGVAEVSSEDIPEAVLDGLFMAIAHSMWNRHGLRLVVLIGNASGHDHPDHPKNPGGYTIDQIVHTVAAPKKVRICAFRLPGATDSDERKFEKQLKRITQGSGPATRGLYHTLEQRQGFTTFFEDIENLLKEEMFRLEILRRAYSTGGSLPVGINQDDRTIVLWNLQASQSRNPVNMNQTFAKGWIPAEVNDKPAVIPYVLVSYEELNVLSILLRGIRTVVEGTGQKEFLKIVVPCIKQLSGDFTMSEQESPQEVLQKRYGLPVHSNIMKMRQDDFVNLEEHEKRWVLDYVTQKLAVLDNFLDSQENWITLGQDYMVGFLPISYLP